MGDRAGLARHTPAPDVARGAVHSAAWSGRIRESAAARPSISSGPGLRYTKSDMQPLTRCALSCHRPCRRARGVGSLRHRSTRSLRADVPRWASISYSRSTGSWMSSAKEPKRWVKRRRRPSRHHEPPPEPNRLPPGSALPRWWPAEPRTRPGEVRPRPSRRGNRECRELLARTETPSSLGRTWATGRSPRVRPGRWRRLAWRGRR